MLDLIDRSGRHQTVVPERRFDSALDRTSGGQIEPAVGDIAEQKPRDRNGGPIILTK